MLNLKDGKRQYKNEYLRRLLALMLCFCTVVSMLGRTISFAARAENQDDLDAEQEQTTENGIVDENQEEIKVRLLEQIEYEDWDPYSADMTIEEFYALMELFDEGTLPLESKNTQQKLSYARSFGALDMDEPGIDDPASIDNEMLIPRTKFLFAGLSKYERREDSEDNNPPEQYDNNLDYEQINEATEDEPQYHYPKGLDPYGSGYMRPPMESWDGISITDTKTKRVILVSKAANAGNSAVAGNVIQDLFAKYTGYYVKQVTVDGANINVLGMIELDDRCVYYYLSAEEQNTQVSTTTLPDEAKFIIEYVPNEHEVDYKVKLGDEYVTENVPSGVVFYGSNGPTKASWVESIFGASPPNRTTDGAYSFDVIVPYGYELRILISIDMTVDIPYVSRKPNKESFYVEIDHTGKKEAIYDAWLNAYYTYLQSEGFVRDKNDFDAHIETKNSETDNIILTWNVLTENDRLDEAAHNSILARMAERINDFVLHNNGYPLGMYPKYTEKGPGGFKVLPNENSGPTVHTMNDTFYNHLVNADRTVTAVLTKLDDPTFDVSQILQKSNGAVGRGGSATEAFAFEDYDEDYEYHLKNGESVNGNGDPLHHGSKYPNIDPASGIWNWGGEDNTFRGKAQAMKQDADGTYYYSWLFQTNSGSDNFYLDIVEVNGISIQVPYFPKYNWRDTYTMNGKYEIADDTHPYYTETTLADGATLRVEFLLGWNGGSTQRHYRISVTGARSNVVVTGLNLMQYSTGNIEFSVYNLVGVYSDLEGQSQTAPAIEYCDNNGSWIRTAQSNVVIYNINYSDGDTDKYGANIRFKIADGYGNPYYIWADRHGDTIEGQSSVITDGDGKTTYNPIISFKAAARLTPAEKGALINGKLDSKYIYDGGDGYYYIRVTTQDPYKIALLTVVARTIKYTVRYTPEYDPNDGQNPWGGFVMDPNTGELNPLTEGLLLDSESMPTFEHSPGLCNLWEMAKDETGEVPEIYKEILHQYDDNGGPFYDLIYNTMASIASNTYGTIRPKDKNKNYTFVDWVLVGDDFMPVKDKYGNVIQFLSGAIDLTKYARYSVKHTAFGSDDTDIHVLRLMPVWKPVNDPFTYNVVLNWVDALGEIHAENFSGYWDEVVTEMTIGGKVYVYLNKDAAPLLSWIANHPTYTFWDDVNNATTETEIEAALKDYLEGGDRHRNYKNILAALLQKDFNDEDGKKQEGNVTFERMGGDVFVVNKDSGTISVWMYENKGGLIFHNDIMKEPFAFDDEFYFTVTEAKVGEGYTTPLNGEYKAYPQFVYDEDGKPRERTDNDAWLVKFKNGEIVSIDGDEEVTYFTLKSGEGIALYVSAGQYTITELGSKSGGSYQVNVDYDANNDGKPDTVPDNIGWKVDNNDGWLPAEVSVTMYFDLGENNVIQTVNFHNMTSTLSIEENVDGSYNGTDAFEFETAFILSEGAKPLYDEKGGYYYYNYNLYDIKYDVNEIPNAETPGGTVINGQTGRIKLEKKDIKRDSIADEYDTDSNLWVCTGLLIRPTDPDDNGDYDWKNAKEVKVALKNSQRLCIVITVPKQGDKINYIVTENQNNNYVPKSDQEAYRTGTVEAAKIAYELFVNVPNPKIQIKLPETGGMGMMEFRLFGGGLIILAFAVRWHYLKKCSDNCDTKLAKKSDSQTI